MVADTVKSASVTALDSLLPNVTSPASLVEGGGAPGWLVNRSDYVVATAGGLASTSSTYKLVRLPTSCILKSADIFTKAGLDSSTGLAIDLGAYYSDDTNDGTPYALQGTLISATCFISNVAFGQSGAGSRINALSNLDANLLTSQLWQQVGLATDPGGYIDIVLAVHTIASGTATGGNIGINVSAVN